VNIPGSLSAGIAFNTRTDTKHLTYGTFTNTSASH